jgi:hypothetical protein
MESDPLGPIAIPAWEIIRTVELEPFPAGPEGAETDVHYRIEVRRSCLQAGVYTVRLYRGELFRMTTTFPQEPDQFEPIHHADEVVWVEDTEIQDFDFTKSTADDALAECLRRIATFWRGASA